MKALTVNLATRPFRNNTVIGSIVAAVAGTLLIATIYNLYIFFSYGSSYALLLDDQSRNRAKLEALEVEERALVKQIEARDYASAFEQGNVANDLILKRTFSWTELFNKLESLMPPDVMMSAIRPNVSSSVIVIRVEGVAKTHLAFLTLQEHLLEHESFSEVYPVSIRRLNPSRPEITFILNFDYRQSERTQADTVVAETAAPPPATGPSSATGKATVEPSSRPDAVPAAAASASALPVGRDGRPRTLEVIARRMVAPGGVYDPSEMPIPAAPAASPQQSAAGTAGSPQAASPSSGMTPEAAAALAAHRAAEAPTTVVPESVPPSDAAQSGPDSAGAVPTGTPRGEAGTGAGAAAATTGAASAGAAGPSTEPPALSDLGLDFNNRPVREIYRILGRAHNSRFVVDATIDRDSTLTVDLTGLSLDEVITLMAGVANHRITEVRPGIYLVVAIDGGENLLEDPPVQEEDLPATEGAP